MKLTQLSRTKEPQGRISSDSGLLFWVGHELMWEELSDARDSLMPALTRTWTWIVDEQLH